MPQPWLHEYNSERPHESLNNLTPEEYRLMAENPETSKSVELKRVRLQLTRTKHSLQQQKDLAWMCVGIPQHAGGNRLQI